MNPAKYYEWYQFACICPGNPTRPANYAVLREKLSAAGVTVIVLWELILLNADIPNETAYTTEGGIYGARERIGDAARAVGAVALADYMPVYPDTTIVPETRDELKTLVKDFAKLHKAELAADIARYGDPSTAPDFDKRQARKEMDRLWGENYRRYANIDRLPFFTAPFKRLREELEAGASLAQLRSNDREIDDLMFWMQYSFPGWLAESNPPEVAAFLEECRSLTLQYPEQLPRWPSTAPATVATPTVAVSQDPAVVAQLSAFGPYKVEKIGPTTMILFGPQATLKNALAPIRLIFRFDGKFPPALLAAWTSARDRFLKALPAMEKNLLALGRQAFSSEIEDADLRPSNDEILAQVTEGTLVIAAEPGGEFSVSCAWDVEWDPEHGCEFQIEENGEVSVE